MKISGNTILITGGGSGIGRALAEALAARGNRVIIAGRRKALLDEVAAATPGLSAIELDVGDPASITDAVARLADSHPDIDVLINNAGIMQPEQYLAEGFSLSTAEATVTTNLLGPIRLTTALLPRLLARPKATVINVSSGLAFLPLALTPTYSATKAAIHSWSISLRHQLQGTGVEVLELAPPYVQTELMGSRQANDPRAMPLAEFIAEVMSILEHHPEATEVLVERVKPLRFAEVNGNFAAIFAALHQAEAH